MSHPEKPEKVVTRFAPSPTGKFHVGGIRSALYNYLYARQHGGKFILRCEDTDPVRSKKEYEDYFLDVFSWLHLPYDEYYRQSERTAIYKRYIEQLITDGKAYVSKEEAKKEGERSEVIRFRNPNKIVTFQDEVLGEISVSTTDLGDFVIARDFESPLYHLTVVIDDFEMGVTHIIRGQEHVSNTPRQILIQEAIGAPRPIYAHASIILNNERAKLSKRDPLVRPALEYRDEGYLPEALLNFMALLGWNPGTDQEIFMLPQLVESFSLDRMQKPGAVFNPEKLEWFNKEHMKRLSSDEQLVRVEACLPESLTSLVGYSREKLVHILPIIIERITHFGEVAVMVENGELEYYFAAPIYDKEKLFWKDERDSAKLSERLSKVRALIEGISTEHLTHEIVKNALWGYAEEEGRGQVLWPLRYALSGRDKSPDPFQLASLFGKTETLLRIDHALTLLHNDDNAQ
jgi:glutamyl-tRNA synthetase